MQGRQKTHSLLQHISHQIGVYLDFLLIMLEVLPRIFTEKNVKATLRLTLWRKLSFLPRELSDK